MARKLIVEIVGDSRSYEKAMGRSTRATKNFQGTVGTMSQKVTASFGTFLKGAVIFEGVRAGMRAVGSAVRAGASEFSQAEQVLAQTNAVLASTGGVAKVTAEDVSLLATRLSRLSGTDDEAIASAENLILTFKNVRNELGQGNRIFDRATLAALDLSKAAGGAFGDLPTTSKQLAKALNDPVRGMTALGRAGVTFSDAQKEAIKAMVESNNILGAQRLILKEVESQVGGSARAFGETLPGQLAKVREAFRNVFGNLAAVVAEPLAAALGAIAGFIPRIEAGVAQFASAVRPIFGSIVDAAREVLPGVLRTVQSVFGPIRQYVEPVIRDVANVIRTSLGNIVQVFDDNRRELTTIFTNLGTVIKSLWTIARPTIVFLFQTVLPAALRVVIPIIEKVTGLYKVMANIFVRATSIILKAIDKLLGAFSGLAGAFTWLPGVGDDFARAQTKIDATRESIRGFTEELDALDGRVVDVSVAVKVTGDFIPGDTHEPSGTAGTGKPEVKPPKVPPRTVTTATTKVVETETERTARLKAAADKAAQDARDAKDALKRRNEALLEAAKVAQFKELGLTGAGERPTPGAGSLLNRAQSLQRQIKGTVLDTDKTRSQLRRIVRFLRNHMKTAGRDVRQAVLGMLNDISSALSGGTAGGGGTGPLTKGSGLNTRKILEGMGLSPEEERELRHRLANVSSGGKVLAAAGGGTKTRAVREGGFGNNPIFVESHTTINLDGQRVAKVVTKQQQKDRRRNPAQKRGPQARIGGT